MFVHDLKKNIYEAILSEGLLDGGVEFAESDVIIERPRSREHGHYYTNAALALAGALKRRPLEIAEAIGRRVGRLEDVESVNVAAPGFVNFFVRPGFFRDRLAEAVAAGGKYGLSTSGGGRKAQVEFVSANPTGPLTVGHGRIAAFGDVVANLLEACGYVVEREYYVNDVGAQIQNLGRSLDARYRELLGEKVVIEEGGYKGDYVVEYARGLADEFGETLLKLDEGERTDRLTRVAVKRIIEQQKAHLEAFGVRYDNWFLESRLHEEKAIEQTLFFLKQRDMIYEKDGATWFRSSDFEDRQDRVLKKTGDVPTYFLSDIAYHKNKFDRGYDLIVNIWGADHHGYVDRITSSIRALGYDPRRLEILIVQLVRFKQSGELVRMSKRAGNIITLADLVEEVGTDVSRFFFLMRARDSHLDFDLELAKDRSEANPLYYLQYAHARICSIIRKARQAGVPLERGRPALDVLTHPLELSLMKFAADYPWEIESCAAAREPHRLIGFLTELAAEFHAYYHEVRVISDDAEASPARLVLCDAVRTVMRNGLSLLGLTAPEEMK
ncbi:MAG: arginine--tRNA ligase [bacterium]